MLKNKILLFITILLFSLLFLCGSVYATDLDVLPVELYSGMTSADKESFEVSSYYILFSNSDNSIYLTYCGSSKFIVSKTGDIYNIKLDSGSARVMQHIKNPDGTFKQDWVGSIIPNSISSLNKVSSVDFYIVGANETIKDSVTDEVFFNPPPRVEGILAPIYQKTPLEGVLQEIVTILPIVLMTIVGLIGLRKALRFLSKVLHRS